MSHNHNHNHNPHNDDHNRNLWIDQYAPKTLNDVISQSKPTQQLSHFLLNWKQHLEDRLRHKRQPSRSKNLFGYYNRQPTSRSAYMKQAKRMRRAKAVPRAQKISKKKKKERNKKHQKI
eukprot:679348_1